MRNPKLTHSLTELQVTASGDTVEREVVYVPLGRSGAKTAIIYKDDLDFLMTLGIGNRWYTNHDQNYVLCFGNRPNKRLMVARLLLNAGPGARVHYKDGNPLNLRRDNLTLVAHNNRNLRNAIVFVPRSSV